MLTYVNSRQRHKVTVWCWDESWVQLENALKEPRIPSEYDLLMAEDVGDGVNTPVELYDRRCQHDLFRKQIQCRIPLFRIPVLTFYLRHQHLRVHMTAFTTRPPSFYVV